MGIKTRRLDFRPMARTILDEVLGYPIEVIEMQLAHAVKDANGRAYNRTKYIKQRHDMMQHWSDYLDSLQANMWWCKFMFNALLSLHLNKYPYIMLCMFIMNVKEKTKLHLTESLQRRFKAIQHIVIFNHNALQKKPKISKQTPF